MNTITNQLDPDEDVLVALQDHWIVMIFPAFVYLLGWIIFLLLFLAFFTLKTVSPALSFTIMFLDFSILFISHHFFFFYLLGYQFSTIIVTNKRIIEVKFFPFFEDDVSFIELNQIHEMEKKIHGFLKNFLNFGDVSVSIHLKKELITFTNVRCPGKFINLIEGVKTKKPVGELDLSSIGVSPSKYKFKKKS